MSDDYKNEVPEVDPIPPVFRPDWGSLESEEAYRFAKLAGMETLSEQIRFLTEQIMKSMAVPKNVLVENVMKDNMKKGPIVGLNLAEVIRDNPEEG